MKSKLSVTGRLFITIALLAVICPGHVVAVDLSPECEPSSLVAKGKEAWNPKDFWTTQIKEIEEYVEGQKTDYRLSMIERRREKIERRREKINQRLDDEKMKAMGFDKEQYSNPEADRFLAEVDRESAETDRELLQIEREILNEAIEWGQKCTAYAKRKLSQLE